jgi:CBS-domain-containing membrane protein
MTTPVVAARVGTDIADVAQIMLTAHLTRIPVLDDRDRLVGLVSRSDLLRPLVRPDADIKADVRQVFAEWGVAGTAEVRVENGEVILATVLGHLHPEVDHLVHAIPGVITVRHAIIDTRVTGGAPDASPALAKEQHASLSEHSH